MNQFRVNSLFPFRSLFLLILLILPACRSDTQSSLQFSPADSIPIVSESSASSGISQLTPSVPLALSTDTPGVFEGYLHEDEAPLELTFPTPGAEAVSLWRPPLYPVPWALNPFDHFYFIRPIAADEINWPLANYRYGGIFFGTDIVHTGIDIPAPRYTPVYAAGAGQVSWAGYGLYAGASNPNDPYGLAVTILHDFSYQGERLYTVYAHLDRIDVITGQQVKPGTLLGLVGITGKTTGPHLHFEVRVGENSFFNTRNPELWLAPPQGWGVLCGLLKNTNGSFLTEQPVTVTSLETQQEWQVISYGRVAVNPDDYYQENLVLSDLPAGLYEISIDYLEDTYREQVLIQAGAITYFTFQGEYGYRLSEPVVADIAEWKSLVGLEP